MKNIHNKSLDLRQEIIDISKEFDFDVIRFTKPEVPDFKCDAMISFCDDGAYGDMVWMKTHLERRLSPKALWQDVKTIIILAVNYAPAESPLLRLKDKQLGNISQYACGDDYHDVIKKRLKPFARRLHEDYGLGVKLFIDTAPLMEKPLAQQAGLGWQGKHTNLVSKEYGSWLFIASIFIDKDIAKDKPHDDFCGSCHACMDICPTKAITAPYQLDARACISYLTIEHKGMIAHEYRKAIGNRIYGCDDCLAICPWNKFAKTSHETWQAILPRDDIKNLKLQDLLALNDASFRLLFRKNPVKRTGFVRFMRNVLISAGNSQNPKLIKAIDCYLLHENKILRMSAIWALKQLMKKQAWLALKTLHYKGETDDEVKKEWDEDYAK